MQEENHPPDPCRLDRNLPTGVYPPGCYGDKCRRGFCRICLQSDQSIPSLDRPKTQLVWQLRQELVLSES